MTKIAILGGTGKEGRGLALRWARGGTPVVLGSRSRERAVDAAAELAPLAPEAPIEGATNREAAAAATAVVSALPHEGHREILAACRDALAGKLLIVATVVWPPGPLDRPSAAEQAQEVLGDAVRVVAAFQTVSAVRLARIDEPLDEDTLVCGPREARREAIALVDRTGLRGVEAGPLAQARVAEALTGLLLKVNKAYGVKTAGIRITGLERR